MGPILAGCQYLILLVVTGVKSVIVILSADELLTTAVLTYEPEFASQC